jgi:AcrR family transcriptional regulator
MPESFSRAPKGTARRANTSKTKPKRGRPVGDHKAKRAELLAAAVAVIAREGYAGASLRKVAARAGCTTGAVTYYFANKEEMVTAVAENLFDVFDTLLEAKQDQVDIKTVLERWLDWMNADDPDPWFALFQLLVHARHEPAFAEVFQRRYGRYRRVLTSVLARGQREGTVRSDIPADLLADQLSAIGDGWMIAFPVETNRFKPSRVQGLLNAAITMFSPPSGRKR